MSLRADINRLRRELHEAAGGDGSCPECGRTPDMTVRIFVCCHPDLPDPPDPPDTRYCPECNRPLLPVFVEDCWASTRDGFKKVERHGR